MFARILSEGAGRLVGSSLLTSFCGSLCAIVAVVINLWFWPDGTAVRPLALGLVLILIAIVTAVVGIIRAIAAIWVSGGRVIICVLAVVAVFFSLAPLFVGRDCALRIASIHHLKIEN